jgi:hypothetical protein
MIVQAGEARCWALHTRMMIYLSASQHVLAGRATQSCQSHFFISDIRVIRGSSGLPSDLTIAATILQPSHSNSSSFSLCVS